jgi:hypothetical protein
MCNVLLTSSTAEEMCLHLAKTLKTLDKGSLKDFVKELKKASGLRCIINERGWTLANAEIHPPLPAEEHKHAYISIWAIHTPHRGRGRPKFEGVYVIEPK